MNIIYFKKINLTDLIIKEKTVDSLNNQNAKNPLKKKVCMSFSNGWNRRFKKHNGFKMYRYHGKSGDAEALAVQQKLSIIQNTTHKHSMGDVRNTDELGLFHKIAPVTTIGLGRLPGRKVLKDRLTFLVYTNVDGQ